MATVDYIITVRRRWWFRPAFLIAIIAAHLGLLRGPDKVASFLVNRGMIWPKAGG